jgi:EmrB/QacA subfamily drug resistance transporter
MNEHTAAGDTDRARWLALYVLCVGMLMIILDSTVVNVALPSIQDELGFSTSSLAWVVNTYLIAFGGLLTLAGRLGDLIGRRRMFLSGLVLFTTASLACGLAQTRSELLTARFIQGIGGAMTSAVILGMIVAMFPESRAQSKAIGVFAFVASAGGAVGLLAGGVLTQLLDWHWIFFINLPIGIVTGLLARRWVEDDQGIGLREGADAPGAVLMTGALMIGVYALVKPAAELGWTAPRTLIFGAVSLGLLGAFLVREAVAAHPLMPLHILRSRNVVGANVIQIFAVAGMFGMFFLGALYLQRVLHYDPLRIGFAFLPVAVLMGTLSIRFSDRLVTRFGARTICVPGLILIIAGLIVFSQVPVTGGYFVHVMPVMILLGAGAGLLFPALMGLAMSDSTDDDAGLASGLVNTTAQVGGALGLAVMATLSATRTRHLRHSGHSVPAALTGGYHFAFWVAAALAAAGLVIATTVLTRTDPDPTEIDADLMDPVATLDEQLASN